jgi:FkbM family methyltransferase
VQPPKTGESSKRITLPDLKRTEKWPVNYKNNTGLFLTLYRAARATGVLKFEWVKRSYEDTYFLYKRFFEDDLGRLLGRETGLIGPGHILDVGANIGYTARLLADYARDTYQVFGFEPEYENFRALCRRTSATERYSNRIEAVHAAVGAHEGEVALALNPDHPADHRVVTESQRRTTLANESGIQKVKLLSLDQFTADRQIQDKIAFVKIDVQGYEVEVVKGMKQVIARNPGLKIFFEYGPDGLIEAGYHPRELLEVLRDEGFQIKTITPKQFMRNASDEDFSQIDAAHGYADFLCIKEPFSV